MQLISTIISPSEKRKHILWLQWLLVVAICYLLDSSDPHPRYVFTRLDAAILGSILVNLAIFFLPRRYFEATALDYLLVFFDISFVSLAIYLTGKATSELYLFFFLILIMAATGQNLRALILGVLTISGLYAWMVYRLGQFTWTSDFLLRIPFLFIIGLFFGYLVYVQKLKEERLRAESEFTADLFEFGKALSQAKDIERLYLRIPMLVKAIMGTDACELVIIEDHHIVRRVFQNQAELELPCLEINKSIHSRTFDSTDIHLSSGLLQNLALARKEDFSFYPYHEYMGKSWKVHARLSGVLAVFSKERRPWSDHDLKKFQFLVDQALLALEHTRLLHELESQARTDGLTGLANHRHFHERMDEELSRARRKHYPVSVIMADVDRFKPINDTYGHRVGDEILRRLATLLKTTTRRMDLAARYGGDEFVLILPESDAEQAQALCERILREVQKLEFDEVPEVSISIGSATFPQDGETISRLVENADQALYHAKGQGRGRSHAYCEAASAKAQTSFEP